MTEVQKKTIRQQIIDEGSCMRVRCSQCVFHRCTFMNNQNSTNNCMIMVIGARNKNNELNKLLLTIIEQLKLELLLEQSK